MMPQQYTANLVLRILNEHQEGLSLAEFLTVMLRESENDNMPLYLGPEITLRQFFERLAKQGRIQLSFDGEVTKVKLSNGNGRRRRSEFRRPLMKAAAHSR